MRGLCCVTKIDLASVVSFSGPLRGDGCIRPGNYHPKQFHRSACSDVGDRLGGEAGVWASGRGFHRRRQRYRAASQYRRDLETQPISLVLAIETSQDASAALERIQRLGSLIDPIIGDGKGEVAVVTFDSEPKLVQDFTPDSGQVTKVLKSLKASGGDAAILDTISFCARRLAARPKNHRKILLIISETRDHGSTAPVEDVIRQLEASNTIVYSSTYSPVLDSLWATPTSNTPNFLNLFKLLVEQAKDNTPQTLSQVSGGEYLPFKSEKAFEDKMTEISNHVFNAYLLSYQPKNLAPGQHTLRVRLKFASDAKLYTRSGYWAAEQTTAEDHSSKPGPGNSH